MRIIILVRVECPSCKTSAYHEVDIEYEVKNILKKEERVKSYDVKNINVNKSISEECFLKDILPSMDSFLRNGICIKEITDFLKKHHHIPDYYCNDVVQRIKIEYDMYSPDQQCLYFVK